MMHEEALSRCLQAAPEYAADIERLFEISPLFASLMRTASEDECRRIFKDKSGAILPDAGSAWFPAGECADEESCKAALRCVKQRALRHIIWWEMGLGGDILVSAASISQLAANLIQFALNMATRLLVPRFGHLPGGRFSVIGLGKFGGNELNLGSDVDLLFIWQAEGNQTNGRKSVEPAVYYQHLSRLLTRLLAELTADGRVWPVDMRLRPGGDAAPICLSLEATLQHYQGYGQTWERAMLIKSRPVAGSAELGQAFIDGIRPFVYRRYLDYTTVQALAEMKRRIDVQAGDRPIGPGFDVKRGRGGIREIEFFIQSLQLLHGGRQPALRCQPSMQALAELVEAGLVEAEQAEKLADAYKFWRQVEHAVQAQKGEQTQVLPEDYTAFLGSALGRDDIEDLMRRHAAVVQGTFQDQFAKLAPEEEASHSWLDQTETDWRQRLESADDESVSRMCHALRDILDISERGMLPERSHRQIVNLVDAAMRAWEGDANRVQALESLAGLFRRIAGRATWFDLMDHHEGVRKWLFDALSASRYIAEHIVEDPSWLEWPLEGGRGKSRIGQLHQEFASLGSEPLDDEQYLAAMSRLISQSRLTSAMTVTADEEDPLVIGSWLSRTADLTTQAVLNLSLRQLGLPEDFPFVCLAMGKHGSLEMGMVSDLDMVFLLVHEAPDSAGPKGKTHREWSQRLGRRMIQHLTTPAPYGAGYEFDARLRPSGQSGVLTTTIEAFSDYQHNEAQTWEHQALCRARPVTGPEAAQARVKQVIDDVIAQPRDAGQLSRDVLKMRARMLEHLGSRDAAAIDLKHNAGGLVDLEFLAQYARLRFAGTHLGTAQTLRGLPKAAPEMWRKLGAELAQTYVDYRQMENALRVQLWQSIGKLSAFEHAAEWETMRRHAPIKSPMVLIDRMRWVREQFLLLLNEVEES